MQYNAVQGTFRESVAAVKQRLNGYLRSCDRIYIGATTDPETRWTLGYAAKGHRKMVVLFECAHSGSCRSMERALIAYARSANFRVKPANVLPGGETIVDGSATYWVYAVLD